MTVEDLAKQMGVQSQRIRYHLRLMRPGLMHKGRFTDISDKLAQEIMKRMNYKREMETWDDEL